MNADNFKELFKAQLDQIKVFNNQFEKQFEFAPSSNEEIYESRINDFRLTYYVRTYPKNQLQLEVKGFWASELPDMHDKFKNGWPPEKGVIPQLEPR